MNPFSQQEAAHHCRAISRHDSSDNARNLLSQVPLAALLLVALPLFAQQSPPTVTAGTRLRVKFDTEVGTAISRVGDGVQVHLLKPVEAEGREALPVGTILTGRVLAVRKGDTHRKVVPVLRLSFERVRLPDGRTFPVRASLADLGILVHVDSEGAATPTPNTKSENVGAAAGAAGAGAGIGAIAGGGSGAAKGAGIGAGIGVLGDLLTRNEGWEDFSLSKGRKAWLRLDDDLILAAAPSQTPQREDSEGPIPTAQKPQGPSTPSTGASPSQPVTSLPPSTAVDKSLPSGSLAESGAGELLIPLGASWVTSLYLDTGPFAAAREGVWWSPTSNQTVVVIGRVPPYDRIFLRHPVLMPLIEVSNGNRYGPVSVKPREFGRVNMAMPSSVEWRFEVGPAESPTALLVPRDATTLGGCPELLHSPWSTGCYDAVPASLGGFTLQEGLAVFLQNSPPVRFGQLSLAVTSVAVGAGYWDGWELQKPGYNRSFVLITYAARNVSDNVNCTALPGSAGRLFDGKGYEYTSQSMRSIPEPRMELLPGEGIGGILLFEEYYETAPRSLVIRRDIGWERTCSEKQHRPVDTHGGSMVRIPISGVPVASPAAR